jgi:hypothetical protein
MTEKIFVQIASYRDPELISTIEDCLEKASDPDRLVFGICWQHDSTENIDKYLIDNRFKIIALPYKDSKGVCWARNKINHLYNNEEYTLQLDSHMRFVEGWDIKLINMWKDLNDEKAILSAYPPNYFPDKEKSYWHDIPQICNVYRFDHSIPISRPMDFPNFKIKNKPVKGMHISGAFLFGPGSLIKDVPYDPEFYFYGEEFAMAARLYTHGYNIYHPHEVLMYHFYQRINYKKHNDDHLNHSSLNEKATERLNSLVGRNSNINFGIYGLGKIRTLKQFKEYSGIDYINSTIYKDIADGIEPPCSNTEEGWDNKKETRTRTFTWKFNEIEKCDDLLFWSIILLDQDEIALIREDVNIKDERIIKLFQSINLTYDIVPKKQIAKTLLIWPYSSSKGWLKQSRFTINTN